MTNDDINTSSNRRKFIKTLGISAGVAITPGTLAASIDESKIKKLNPVQQEFMVRYGKWMDEFIEVVRIQKTDPDQIENNKNMIALTERAESMQPELSEHLKDPIFSLIYKASIQRVSAEI